MSAHTTFGIGGPADMLVVVTSISALESTVLEAYGSGVPYMVLGMGANVLVSDRGVRGLVIVNRCDAIAFDDRGSGSFAAQAESGARLAELARQSIARGLAGLEWAVDVPGTVGGAVVGNAGAYGGYVSDNLEGVTVFTAMDGESRQPADLLGLSYRDSLFKRAHHATDYPPVILSASFTLRQDTVAEVTERASEFSRRRQDSQPSGASAGSVFKRTEQHAAGYLIERAGLKGRRCGGAEISSKHANFIVNRGAATAAEVMELVHVAEEAVMAKFGLALELEIELVGEW